MKEETARVWPAVEGDDEARQGEDGERRGGTWPN